MTAWQSPVQEVECPHRGRKTKAWIMWISENEVELRVINITPYPIICTEYLGPDGNWHWIDEAETIPVSKVMPATPLVEKGIIKALEDDVHVYEPNYDRCLRCGYNGQQLYFDKAKGFELRCVGWLYGAGIG